MALVWQCKDHGIRPFRYWRGSRGRNIRAYCDICVAMDRTVTKIKRRGNPGIQAQRYREWYVKNRERKIAYQKAYIRRKKELAA